jgi:hypothetical protein
MNRFKLIKALEEAKLIKLSDFDRSWTEDSHIMSDLESGASVIPLREGFHSGDYSQEIQIPQEDSEYATATIRTEKWRSTVCYTHYASVEEIALVSPKGAVSLQKIHYEGVMQHLLQGRDLNTWGKPYIIEMKYAIGGREFEKKIRI